LWILFFFITQSFVLTALGPPTLCAPCFLTTHSLCILFCDNSLYCSSSFGTTQSIVHPFLWQLTLLCTLFCDDPLPWSCLTTHSLLHFDLWQPCGSFFVTTHSLVYPALWQQHTFFCILFCDNPLSCVPALWQPTLLCILFCDKHSCASFFVTNPLSSYPSCFVTIHLPLLGILFSWQPTLLWILFCDNPLYSASCFVTDSLVHPTYFVTVPFLVYSALWQPSLLHILFVTTHSLVHSILWQLDVRFMIICGNPVSWASCFGTAHSLCILFCDNPLSCAPCFVTIHSFARLVLWQPTLFYILFCDNPLSFASWLVVHPVFLQPTLWASCFVLLCFPNNTFSFASCRKTATLSGILLCDNRSFCDCVHSDNALSAATWPVTPTPMCTVSYDCYHILLWILSRNKPLSGACYPVTTGTHPFLMIGCLSPARDGFRWYKSLDCKSSSAKWIPVWSQVYWYRWLDRSAGEGRRWGGDICHRYCELTPLPIHPLIIVILQR
jgi:hypothetical protein